MRLFRYEEALWDPQGKPPSGRVKSAPSVKSHLPPRFQRRAEPARRLDSENSVVSDWSLEVEEEEERRSLDGASPFRTEDIVQHQPFLPASPPTGPGIIRLAAMEPVAPVPHPAWRSMEPENWRYQAGSYYSLPGHGQQHHFPTRPQLYDPNSYVRPVRLEGAGGLPDRQTSPDYPGPPFPNARIPMVTSRQVVIFMVKSLLPVTATDIGTVKKYRCRY